MGGSPYVVVLVAVLLTFALGSDVQPIIVRGYEEPCTCDGDCQFSQWLACINGFCRCLSTTFLYDFNRETCVVRLGHKCFEVGQDYKEYKELPPFIRCVQGAFCSISLGGLCACNTYGFYEEGERCLPRKDFDTPCTLSVQCKSDLCSPRGRCSCREGQYYHMGRERCLGLAGSFCFADEDCTDNAVCNGEDGKCLCASGFQGPNCLKALRYGDACNPLTPCNNIQLSCFNGHCLCTYPDHQIYDNVTGNCQSLVGSAPCHGDHMCVSNAHCFVGDDRISACECVQGFLEMGDGSCQTYSGYGTKCEADSECDPLTPLVCKDWKCDCRESLTLYDPIARICRGLVGFRNCSKGPTTCVQNSDCVQLNPNVPSKCTCRPNFTPTANRTCLSRQLLL